MSENKEQGNTAGMDRFTRNYLIFLGVLVVILLGSWLASWDARVSAINDRLEADAQLSSYPYQFRVLALDKGVARLSTPRSFKVPVVRFLGIIHPELRNKSQDDPAMMAAQGELARHQKRAAELVQEHPEVQSIRWELDEGWYAERGLSLN